MYKFKRDKYQKARGGKSRVLDVSCEKCGEHICYYQKDGPGLLKRMYVDRFIDTKPTGNTLKCSTCELTLGILIIYEKESRNAYRLYVGAVHKRAVSSKLIH